VLRNAAALDLRGARGKRGRRAPNTLAPPVRTGEPVAAMIDKLEFLLALARERHFGRAATACGVTQPTLSAGLRQIEGDLGVRLVNRGARFHSLTPEGERVLAWARRIVGDARALREEVEALKHGLVGHLRIGAVPTALAMVQDLTTPYRAQHPDVTFEVRSGTSAELLDRLENHEIDAALSYLDEEATTRARGVPIYRERYCLLTAPDDPLAGRGSVTWAEVGRRRLCLPTPDMQNRRIVDRLLADAGVDARPTLVSNSMFVLFTHVRTGRWSTVMPVQLATTLRLVEELSAIPIVEPDASQVMGLVIPARDPVAPLTAALVEVARGAAARFGDGL
jgi:DNA-binding transcriptional LysR family regulator